MNNKKMLAKDAVSAKLGECYVTIENDRFHLMQLKNIEATMELKKADVPILGKTGMGHKLVGWDGKGSATLYLNTSVFRKLAHRYKETGESFYFDMQLTNEDPTASVGRQTVILRDCSMDKVVLAKIDADAEILEEDFDFTFEDFDFPEQFTELKGMS